MGKADGYQNNRQAHEFKKFFSPDKSNFAGLKEDLKGCIYEVGTISQADQLITTTKTIKIYAGWNYTNPQKIRTVFGNLDDVTFIIPEKQECVNNDISTLLLGKELDTYTKRRNLNRKKKATM